jgi:ABC-3C biological conflict system middle component
MILPTKKLSQDRALLFVGAQILQLIRAPITVSHLWDDFKAQRDPVLGYKHVPYDWFVLALAFLYSSGAIDLSRGRLRRAK